MRSRIILLVVAIGLIGGIAGPVQAERILWFSPLVMSTGDSRLTIEPATLATCVRITTSAPGDLQWVDLGLTLPSDVTIEEVTFCYELASSSSFVSQVRLTTMTTPVTATVVHDDPTDVTNIGPACYSSPVASVPVDGTITLRLRLNFASNNDWIDFGAIALRVNDTASGVIDPLPGSQATGLMLRQNQPNPFYPNTLISYGLETGGAVEVEVVDVGGRVVRRLFQGTQDPGEHGVHWDGRNDQGLELPSGTYYFTVRAGNRVDSKGMVLLR